MGFVNTFQTFFINIQGEVGAGTYAQFYYRSLDSNVIKVDVEGKACQVFVSGIVLKNKLYFHYNSNDFFLK